MPIASTPIVTVLEILGDYTPCKGGYRARCPSHNGKSRTSLSISQGEDGRVLLFCHSGCRFDQIVRALGISKSDLFPSKNQGELTTKIQSSRWTETRYPIREADGTIVAYHVRKDDTDGEKQFAWLQPDEQTWGLNGRLSASMPLYGIDKIIGDEDKAFVAEGEKSTDALRSIGIHAFGTVCGANGAPDDDSLRPILSHTTIFLWPDNDDPGRRHMTRIAERLWALGHADVRMVGWPAAPPKGDAADFVKSGGDRAAVHRLVKDARLVSADSVVCAKVPSSGARCPIDSFPEPFRSFICHASNNLDCPPDFVAANVIALTAGVIGNTCELHIKRDWVELPIFWLAVVSPPGAAKTPALKAAISPVSRLQKEAFEQFHNQMAEYERKLDDYERAKRKRGGTTPEKPRKPELEHYYSTDCTMEGLSRILGGPNSITPGVTLLRDELVSWIRSFDSYRQAGDRQNWMSLWAGVEAKVDRASRSTAFMPKPVVSVVGGIQPDVLTKLEEEAGLRDGFLDRFLFVFPDTWPMRFKEDAGEDAVNEIVLRTLSELRTHQEARTIRLSHDARQLFSNFYNENAQAQESQTGLVQGYMAKLPTQLARLALILHCMAEPERPDTVPISANTMYQALKLAAYFQKHALKVFGHFGVAAHVQDPLAPRIVRAIESRDGVATTTQLHDALGRHVRAADRDRALESLEAAGLIHRESMPTGDKGGRPGYRFRLPGKPCAQTEETAETPWDGSARD